MDELIQELLTILEDTAIPKNVRQKIESAIAMLQEKGIEESIHTNKTLQ